MNTLKWVTQYRYSYFDVAVLFTTVHLVTNQRYWTALAVFIFGFFVSGMLEHAAKNSGSW